MCRSLFEKDKLLFAFLLAVRILMSENSIDMDEWTFLLTGVGGALSKDQPNPATDWLSERAWKEMLSLSTYPHFENFTVDFPNHLEAFRIIFDSPDPHR